MPIVTTYLEMRSPDDLDPKRCADPHFWIDEATVKQWQRVGWDECNESQLLGYSLLGFVFDSS